MSASIVHWVIVAAMLALPAAGIIVAMKLLKKD
jgi:cytochrome b561